MNYMDTTQYIEYSKKGAIGGAVLFCLGILGSAVTNLLSIQLPPQLDGILLYMLILGVVAVFVSIIAIGVLPLALE